MKISKSREKYLLEKFFQTKNKKDIPTYLSQFGCRDCETTDEDLYFVTRYVTRIDRLSLGGSLVTKAGLKYIKELKEVEYLDLRSMALDDENLDNILHLYNLEYLYVKFTHISTNGISRILESFPDLQNLIAEIDQKDINLIEQWELQYPNVELNISVKN